jgi:Family of unknown function (DUF6152)
MRGRSDITSTILPVLGVLSSLALGGAQLLAHHGWTGYQEKETQLTGTITSASYENPHGQVDLSVDGKRWQIVLAPPSRMQSRGLDRGMLKVGSQATVVGYIHKTTPTELRAERITIGGKTTELR